MKATNSRSMRSPKSANSPLTWYSVVRSAYLSKPSPSQRKSVTSSRVSPSLASRATRSARPAVAADRRLQTVPGLGLPLGALRALGLFAASATVAEPSPSTTGGGLRLAHEPPSSARRCAIILDETNAVQSSEHFPYAWEPPRASSAYSSRGMTGRLGLKRQGRIVAGAVLGPRHCGHARSTTVSSGQQAPQLDSRIRP